MERLRAVRTRKYAIFQYTCRREPRPVAAAPSTCSLRKSLTWNGVAPQRHPPSCATLLTAHQLASTRLFSWTGANRQVSMDYWLDRVEPAANRRVSTRAVRRVSPGGLQPVKPPWRRK